MSTMPNPDMEIYQDDNQTPLAVITQKKSTYKLYCDRLERNLSSPEFIVEPGNNDYFFRRNFIYLHAMGEVPDKKRVFPEFMFIGLFIIFIIMIFAFIFTTSVLNNPDFAFIGIVIVSAIAILAQIIWGFFRRKMLYIFSYRTYVLGTGPQTVPYYYMETSYSTTAKSALPAEIIPLPNQTPQQTLGFTPRAENTRDKSSRDNRDNDDSNTDRKKNKTVICKSVEEFVEYFKIAHKARKIEMEALRMAMQEGSPAETLRQFGQLHQEGIIDADEFAQVKTKLLSRTSPNSGIGFGRS